MTDRRMTQHQFADLSGGQAFPVISVMSAPTPSAGRENGRVHRVVGCSGGVFADFRAAGNIGDQDLLLYQTCSKNHRHGVSVQASPPDAVIRRLERS